MKNFVFCGIDPGVTGAISFYRADDEKLVIFDMPVRERVNGRKEVCPNVVAGHLAKFFPRFPGVAIIEKVASMPRDGSVQAFSFGRSFGVCLGAVAAVGVTAIEVRPAIWKGAMNLGRDKGESITMARKLFPSFADYFTLKKHDGRAEAAILAYYGEEIWQMELGDPE